MDKKVADYIDKLQPLQKEILKRKNVKAKLPIDGPGFVIFKNAINYFKK
jgi:hypothetical protein